MSEAVPLTSLTCAPYVSRVWLNLAIDGGLERSQAARLPGVAVLDDDGVRISPGSVQRILDVAAAPVRNAGGSARMVDMLQQGALGVWDYLFSSAATLADGWRAAGRHFAVVCAPGDSLVVDRGPDGTTVRWLTVYPENMALPDMADAFAGFLVARAASAAGRPLRPVRVELPHPAPRRYERLVDLCGTRRIDFDAGSMSVTFAEADAEAPLPGADPALAAILERHAEMAVAGARPVLGWLDRFHTALDGAFDGTLDPALASAAGPPDLPGVARRLGLSPRTLQRRLRDEGTSWREEVEHLQQRRVGKLLRETSLTMESIATRVGYGDARALRRAVRRWYGRSPAALRREAAPPP